MVLAAISGAPEKSGATTNFWGTEKSGASSNFWGAGKKVALAAISGVLKKVALASNFLGVQAIAYFQGRPGMKANQCTLFESHVLNRS